MPQPMQDLIDDYVTAVRKIYGDHIRKIILYGSYARGDFTEGSDIDIMLLVDLRDEQIDRFSDDLSELGFDYNVLHDKWFMPVVRNIEHFNHWREVYPLYSNIAREGVLLYNAA